MSDQLLHLVIGGELADVEHVEFRDLTKVEFVGAYPNYAEAHKAWRARAQQTVDNALMRFFVLHAHKLIDPVQPPHEWTLVTDPNRAERFASAAEAQHALDQFPTTREKRVAPNPEGVYHAFIYTPRRPDVYVGRKD